MIRAVVLSVVAWACASAFGLPVDAFLPLVVAIGLQRGWPMWTRLILGIGLAPLAAAASGDLLAERATLYAIAVCGSANLTDWFDDGVRVRSAFTGLALVGFLATRSVMAWAGAIPSPSESMTLVVATIAFAALHAAISTAPLRLPRRAVAPRLEVV